MPVLKVSEPATMYVKKVDKDLKPTFTEKREEAKVFTDVHAHEYMRWSNVVHCLGMVPE